MTTATIKMQRREEPEWAVWLTVLAGLLIGALVMTLVTGRVQTGQAGASTLSYPAAWIKTSQEGAVFAATNLSGGAFGERVSVQQVAKADLAIGENSDPQTAAMGWAVSRGADLEGYRVLGITPTVVDGKAGMSVEYVYLTDAPLSAGGAMPSLMHAIDTLIPVGEEYYVLTVAGEANDTDVAALNQTIVGGWQLP